MGGDSGQPFIYDRPKTYAYSDFNPRAATQAIEKKREEDEKRRSKKQDGPLINFNAHPDSYMIVPGKNVNHKTMSKHTKPTVKALRWTQLTLRILEEIGAIGLMVCVVCLRKMETSTSWIIRVAPAWDILVALYAIYHFCRKPTARTPASSASYHCFALFMDIGLTPFFVFIALLANTNYQEEPGTKHRWTSVFDEDAATTTLLQATFLAAAVMGGFHLISAILDLWLVIVFRKISNLPPDMNPLEDNLTSRGPTASKHKYKNSEITLVGSVDEKKPGYLSGSTISVDDQSRLSTANKEPEDVRRVPFRHSRTGSEATFSPHNPDSVRWFRQNYQDAGIDMYQQPGSARSSQVYNQTRSAQNSPSKHSSFVEQMDWNRTRPMSAARPTSQYGPNRFSSPALPNPAPSNALVKSQQKQSLLNDNWVTVDDEVAEISTLSRHRTPAPIIQVEERHSFEVQPLRMNPPTPPPQRQIEYRDFAPSAEKRSALGERRDNGNADLNRHLTVKSVATESSSVYSESAPPLKPIKMNNSPKAKYYGDLQTAARGVRGVKSIDTIKSNGTVEAATMDSTGFGAMSSYGFAPSPPRKSSKRRSDAGGNGRVVSRTGVDIVDAQALYPENGGFGMRGRRDVSGKIAEEGRGGRGWMRGWK